METMTNQCVNHGSFFDVDPLQLPSIEVAGPTLPSKSVPDFLSVVP